jgi:hypothetical protein
MTTGNSQYTLGPSTLKWRPREGSPQEARLFAAMLNAEARLRLQVDSNRQDSESVIQRCREALQLADTEASRSVYVAWDCLHQFDAAELRGLLPDEREARWYALKAEADQKLKGWRRTAAESLKELATKAKEQEEARQERENRLREKCPEPEEEKAREEREKRQQKAAAVPPHLASELHFQLATTLQNGQFKLELLQRDVLPVVRWMLIGVIALALGFAAVVFAVDRYVMFEPWAKAIVLGVPAGALGAIVSMAFALGRADLNARIPELRFSNIVTGIRPLLGAAVAIPILVLVQADAIKLSSLKEPAAIFALCFLGGWSERWFLTLMEGLEGKQQKA